MRMPASNQRTVAVADSPASASPLPMSEVWVNVCGGIEGGRSHDLVAEEIPVAMVYNGVSHAVMMASPCDLDDFALGFSMSEGILQRPDQMFSVEIKPGEDGIELDMHIAGDCFARLREQRRNMTGRTGCGLCGSESLAHVVRAITSVTSRPLPTNKAVQASLKSLKKYQPLQLQTGATHGAAWCNAKGDIVQAREDVGRHNALDKLIGARLREFGDQAFSDGFALISSRASFEMVQKSASVGAGTLVAVSAPTALAIREARKSGMNLVGFARPGRHVIYARSGDSAQEEPL